MCRLNAFLRRPDVRETGRAPGGPAHRRGLSAGVWPPTPAPPRTSSSTQLSGRSPNTPHGSRVLAPARPAPVITWWLCSGGEALHALRGVQLTVAVTTGAALGDRSRVAHPRPRMKERGLTPSESSRGERRRPGGRTKPGKPPARRVLVEGAGAARDPATVRRHRHRRRETLPKPLQDTRGKAQVRRGKRDRQHRPRGNTPHQGVGAMARERVAWMGTMAPQGPVTASRWRRPGPWIERPTGGPAHVPQASGSGAAPGWGHPRRRAEGHQPRASRAAGPRRAHGRWEPPPGAQPDHPSGGLAPPLPINPVNNPRQPYHLSNQLLTVEVIATPRFRRAQ